MIGNKKVIAFTPAGRERYMEILVPYVVREHEAGHIDEWVLFNNAYNSKDEKYVRALPGAYPWIRIFEQEGHRDAFHIHSFYKLFHESDAIYVRLDDDIVYIAPDAIEILVTKSQRDEGEYFLNYPVILGNSRMEYWLQHYGRLPMEWGELTNEILTPLAFNDEKFVEKVHRLAIERIKDGTFEETFSIPTTTLSTTKMLDNQTSPSGHVSVNCFALAGEKMMALKDLIVPDEERFLSLYRPAGVGEDNIIVGSAIVIHFAYHTQTEALEKTELLDAYKQLSMNV